MLAYTLKRILATLPVMGFVVVFVFLLVRIAPGDPAAILAGDYATPENVQKIRAGLGLDKPIHLQFALYVGSLIRGDLGQSLHSRRPVSQLIVQRIEPTLALAMSTLIFAETTTIGVRHTLACRQTLDRGFVEVATEFGPVTIKVSTFGGRRVNFAPEYECCRRLAQETGAALKDIMAAASRAFLELGSS